jgi:hypothetical protein
MELHGQHHYLSWFCHFCALKNAPVSRMVGGSHSQFRCSGEERNLFFQPGFEPWFSQLSSLLSSSYTNRAILTALWIVYESVLVHKQGLNYEWCGTLKLRFWKHSLGYFVCVSSEWFSYVEKLWFSLSFCQSFVVGLMQERMCAVRIVIATVTGVLLFHCPWLCHVATDITCPARPNALQPRCM